MWKAQKPAGLEVVLFCLVCAVFGLAQNSNTNAAVHSAYLEGEKALSGGDLVEAEKSFRAVLKLIPNDPGARINLAVIFMREKKWPLALEYLNQAEKIAPQVIGIRLNIGLVRYRQGDYSAAIPDFKAVLKEQPDSVQARRLLGLCLLFEERYSESAEALEPLWPMSNQDVSYLYSLAVAAGNAGRHDLEERAEAQLMKAAGQSPLVHLLLGKACLAHEDYENALVELKKAAEADEKLPMVHYNLGVVYRHNGELETARSEFLKDVALEPGVAFNYDQLGLIASLDAQDREAEAYFLDAVKYDKRLGTSWFGLAKVYRQEKRYPEALKALREAAGVDPNSASVHYLLAQVLEAMGRRADSQAEYRRVQELKKETVDRLERQVTGAKYSDPDLPAQ